MNGQLLFVAVFLACAVETVEALTIVLARGVIRGWRTPLQGAAASIAVLAVLVAVLGPALGTVPIGLVRLVVGPLLLVFGLQWLRKAILRAAGWKSLRDEDASCVAATRHSLAARRAEALNEGQGLAEAEAPKFDGVSTGWGSGRQRQKGRVRRRLRCWVPESCC